MVEQIGEHSNIQQRIQSYLHRCNSLYFDLKCIVASANLFLDNKQSHLQFRQRLVAKGPFPVTYQVRG